MNDLDDLATWSTSQQLADFLGVPLGTIRRWRHVGSGPRGVRLGRHVRYAKSEVATWLDQAALTQADPS